MSNAPIVPCVSFPKAKTIAIPLPFGVDLRSIADISKGPPTDCSLAHSLMLQITPMLAGMACMLKVLAVIKALKDAVSADPPNFINLLTKIDDLAHCFLLLDPCELSKMIAGILRMIISYLNCLIDAFESIWNFQIGIDLNAANGNPVLLASLNCAMENAQTSLESLMESTKGVEPLFQMIGMLLEIVGLPALTLPPLAASTPKLSSLSPGEDPIAPVKTLRDALRQAHDALPCK